MRRVRQKGTSAELQLRSHLHALGLRYRVQFPALPGLKRKVDLAFTRIKIAVFVDGCFWHSCPIHGTKPKENSAWWSAKLEQNIHRDRDTDRRLREAGWTVLRYWEHENFGEVAQQIEKLVRDRYALDNRP